MHEGLLARGQKRGKVWAVQGELCEFVWVLSRDMAVHVLTTACVCVHECGHVSVSSQYVRHGRGQGHLRTLVAYEKTATAPIFVTSPLSGSAAWAACITPPVTSQTLSKICREARADISLGSLQEREMPLGPCVTITSL